MSEKLPDCKVGERLNAPEVLLVGRRDKTWVGRPTVPGAKVSPTELAGENVVN